MESSNLKEAIQEFYKALDKHKEQTEKFGRDLDILENKIDALYLSI